MSKDHEFKSIKALKKRINSLIEKVVSGDSGLDEMAVLLNDIKELEERIIIIRYKAMEALAGKSKKKKEKPSAVAEPELPLEMLDEELDTETAQISLIDSIEEISNEISINENHGEDKKPSLAEQLNAKPIKSIMKSLSVNQKIGIVSQLFKGDDEIFRKTIHDMDKSADLSEAAKILKSALPDMLEENNAQLLDLNELMQRRFL